jgi:hypothetical protein
MQALVRTGKDDSLRAFFDSFFSTTPHVLPSTCDFFALNII